MNMSSAPDPAARAWLDQEDEHTARVIRAYGVFIQYVGGDSRRRETPFAYTVGLFGLGHPEVLIAGVCSHTAGDVLNEVAAMVKAGRTILPGEVLTFAGWSHRVVAETVPNAGEIAFAANRFYDRPPAHSVGLLQLTYDDANGRFPWEEGYSTPAWVQPRPGVLRA
jgi:hypothetical protein